MSLCFKTILRNKVRLYLVRDNGILALQLGSSEASEVVKPVFLSKVSKVVLFMETISFFRFAKKRTEISWTQSTVLARSL